jgi:tetratricopeptide (TPR) repeat protein
VYSRHASYYLRAEGEEVEGMSRDAENIRGAWDWALRQGRSELLHSLIHPFSRYFNRTARFHDGLEFFLHSEKMLLESGSDQTALLGKVLLQQGWFYYRLGQHPAAIKQTEQGLTLLRPLDEPVELWFGLNTLGAVANREGEHARSRVYFAEAYRKVASREGLAGRSLNNLAIAEYRLGHYRRAERYFDRALTIYRRLGMNESIMISLMNLAGLALQTKRPHDAVKLLQDSLHIARSHHNLRMSMQILSNLIEAHLQLGEFAPAIEVGQEAHKLTEETHYEVIRAEVLVKLGRAFLGQGDGPLARLHFVQGIKVLWALHLTAPLLQALTFLAQLEVQQGHPEQATRLLTLVKHHPESMSEDRSAAEKGLKSLAKQPQSQKVELDQVVGDILGES